MNTDSEKQMKDRIMDKIASQSVAMRPRVYFTARIVLTAVTATLVFFLSIFILNFILFSIRLNNHDALLGFGPRGLLAFLMFFPWGFLAADIVLMYALQRMLRWFSFGYRTPTLFLLGALLVSAVVAGVVVDRGTPLNDNLLERAEERGLPPPAHFFYGHARIEHDRDGVCRCTITAIDGNVLTVEDRRSSTTLQVMLPLDNAHATVTDLSVGDRVFIAGDLDDGVISAFGVRKLPDDRPRPGVGPGMK